MVSALATLSMPTTAADLQQFLCATNWIRGNIPRFTELIDPLQQLLIHCSKIVNSFKQTQLRRVNLILQGGWTSEHTVCFSNIKEVLSRLITMAHVKADWRLCFFPDGSNGFWSVLLTQIPPEDMDLDFSEQRHEPLAFISGAFKGSQLRWATIEKEGFPIVEGVHRFFKQSIRS
jgi:reverse transcriptase-like protein